jgi:hypothetical protein
MLRIEPTLPMLKIEPALPILAILAKLRMPSWVRALGMLRGLLKPSPPEMSAPREALGCARDRFRREAAYVLPKAFAPFIFLPIRLTRLLSINDVMSVPATY